MICDEHLYTKWSMFVALLLFGAFIPGDLPFPLSETSGGQGPTGEATKLQLTRLAVKDLPMLGLSKMVPQNKTWIFFSCQVHANDWYAASKFLEIEGMDETWGKWMSHGSFAKRIWKSFILIRRCAATLARCASALNLKILSTLNSTWSLTM